MDVYLRNYQRMKRTKNIYGCILSFYKIKYEIVKISKLLRRELNEKKVKVIDENGSKLVVIGFVGKQNGHVNKVEDYGYLTDNNGKITFS